MKVVLFFTKYIESSRLFQNRSHLVLLRALVGYQDLRHLSTLDWLVFRFRQL